jgi:hypothetical protein
MSEDESTDGTATGGAVDSNSPDASQRWAVELERDRVAALMMRPSHGFAGPGAADGGIPEEDTDETSSEDDDVDQDESSGEDGGESGKSGAQKAADIAMKRTLWGRAAAIMLKNPIPTIVILAPIVGLMFLPIFAQFMVLACSTNKSCASLIGLEVLKGIFSSFLRMLKGG